MKYEFNKKLSSIFNNMRKKFNSTYEIIKIYDVIENKYNNNDWDVPSIQKKEKYIKFMDLKTKQIYDLHKSIFYTFFTIIENEKEQ